MWDTDLVVIFTGVVAIVLILAGAFVLRPFFKRLADVMDRYLSERGREESEMRRLDAMHELLEGMNQRLSLMEERLDFTESLVTEERRGPALEEGSGGEPSGGEPADGEPAGRA